MFVFLRSKHRASPLVGYVERKVNEAHTEISGNFSLGEDTDSNWMDPPQSKRASGPQGIHSEGGEGCGEGTAVKGRWYSDDGEVNRPPCLFWERLQGKKRQTQEKLVAYTGWGMLIGLTITNTTRGGLCSQCDCFNPYYSPIWKILLSSWLWRPRIWGQRDDEIAEEYPVYQLMMKLGEKAGSLAPGLYSQWLYLLPVCSIQRRILREKIWLGLFWAGEDAPEMTRSQESVITKPIGATWAPVKPFHNYIQSNWSILLSSWHWLNNSEQFIHTVIAVKVMDNGVSPQSMWKPTKMEEAGSVSSTSTGGFCISLQNHDFTAFDCFVYM